MIDIDKYKTIASDLKSVSKHLSGKEHYVGVVKISSLALDASEAINNLISFIEDEYSKEKTSLNEFCEFMSRK